MKNKDIIKRLNDALDETEDLRIDYFKTFPEDANEDRISWSNLYDMSTDDNYKIHNMRCAILSLITDIRHEDYDD